MTKQNMTQQQQETKEVISSKFVQSDEIAHIEEGKRQSFGIQTIQKIFKKPTAIFLVFAILVAFYVQSSVEPTYVLQKVNLDAKQTDSGLSYVYKGKDTPIENPILANDSLILSTDLSKPLTETLPEEEFVLETKADGSLSVEKISLKQHWGLFSLLPALVAIVLCLLTKEPVSALFSGVLVGAIILGKFDLVDAVFLETLATKNAASIILLYLWLLGGLLGIWSRTGAAQAFANVMTKYVVRGPKSARLVAWLLGIIFFQGGTMSTVLVGTTVKPIADKEKISHEELSYIVDSTASPIACLLAFNAWPAYIQAFLFVGGVGFLATEAARLSFFFKSLAFSFYSIFAIIGTLLLCLDKAPYLGKQLRGAIKRSRETGKLDADGSSPLSAKELEGSTVPSYYSPHIIDFFVPLALIIGVSIGTFIATGSPNVRLGFGLALASGVCLALIRGMKIIDVVEGMGEGFKGVVLGSIILVLAITIGKLSQETGGGLYMVELLGSSIPYFLLPLILLAMTIVIAFSTGTSWGTYAVTFPLAMPLAWALATSAGLANPEVYMMICFATVLNGSVIGDQCSPISDTTILSSMATGCDLMDHVKTQVHPAGIATLASAICWTLSALFLT